MLGVAKGRTSSKQFWFAGVLLALLCATTVGCWNSTDTPTNPSETPVAVTSPDPSRLEATGSKPVEPATMDGNNVATAAEAAGDDVGEGSAPAVDAAAEPGFEPTGSWSRRRLVAMAPTGLQTIEVAVSVGGMSLEASSAATAASIVDELLAEVEQASWEAILDLPLVRSGWLGNLLVDEGAEEGQKAQLIDMYDENGDGEAGRDELIAFLTRGLSRQSPWQLTEGGPESNLSAESPWGPADLDGDYALDLTSELNELESSLRRLDFNEDGTVTRQEAIANREMEMNTAMARSFLDANTMLDIDVAQEGAILSDTDTQQREKKLRSLASQLLKQYSFLGSIGREQFSHWPDAWWAQWDADGNKGLDRNEVASLLVGEPAATLYVRLPRLEQADQELESQARSSGSPDPKLASALEVHALSAAAAEVSWIANKEFGGRLLTGSCRVRVSVVDEFSPTALQRLRAVLQQALGNGQLQEFARARLQLADHAFELLDGDADGQLSDAEFQRSLGWLAIRGGGRILASWSTAVPAWFEMVDRNADGRLTLVELRAIAAELRQLDGDEDGSLTPYELPLLVGFAIRRSDSRLDGLNASSEQLPSVVDESDWFSAMDTNGDEVVSFSEFLGSRETFNEFDQNNDGFVSKREVYEAP